MFLCGKGIGVFFRPQNGSSNVKINHADALLSDCRLSKATPGLCSGLKNPQGTPPFLPCPMPVISGSWKNKVTLKNGMKDVLTSDCSIKCTLKKGKITPFFPTTLMLNVDDNARVQAVKTDQISNNDNEKASENTESAEQVKQLPSAEAIEQLETSEFDTTDSRNALEEWENENKQEQENEENAEDNVQEEVEEVDYALCDYKNCGKAKNCEYYKSLLKKSVLLNPANSSGELRNNMQSDLKDALKQENLTMDFTKASFDLYDSYFNIRTILLLKVKKNELKVDELKVDDLKIAHHHLIPGNDCLSKYPELVYLANYYGYDINNGRNGICLVTGASANKGGKGIPFEDTIPFKAMNKLKKQWHSGSHRYSRYNPRYKKSSLTIKADFDALIPRPFLDYATAVDFELIAFSCNLRKNMKCRGGDNDKNKEQSAKRFVKAMDRISQRIAKKLLKFEKAPHRSYPFYVSRMAFYYAFDRFLKGSGFKY